MRFNRLFLSLLAASALVALASFASPASAQISALPERPNEITRSVGKLMDFTVAAGQPTGTTTTSYDVFDFGFQADFVSLCTRGGSNPVYFRMANAVTTSATVLAASFAGQQHNTVPVSTSSAFIVGDAALPNGIGRAVPLMSASSSASTAGKDCVTMPLRGPGVVVHVASGNATVEVQGFSR